MSSAGVLRRLTIRDFAIVDSLEVEWHHGLNVITGETGTGKSILVDAVGALLGDRLGPEIVRAGADRAVVEGLFLVGGTPPPEVATILAEYGVEPEDGAVVVSREMALAGGRGGARVNGRMVPLAVLQQLGEQLVDVHGQAEHMALLRPREQLNYLDRFADALSLRAEVSDLVGRLRDVRAEIATLQSDERQALREQEMLRHEIAEIEAAAPRLDEEEELGAAQGRLRNAQQLRQLAGQAYQALNGRDDAAALPAAIELLGEAARMVAEGAALDATLGPRLSTIQEALGLAEEASLALRHYAEAMEEDPTALEEVENRLVLLSDLKRKYGPTLADILSYVLQARDRLGSFEQRGERVDRLRQEEQQIIATLVERASRLSVRRRDAAGKLEEAVKRELKDLGMAGTEMQVSIARDDDPHGLPIDGRPVALSATGIDRVEILLSANPGEPPRPLARVASGGELARIALAIKTTLARADTRSTLVFDEVDAGVGGRTAPVVGHKLSGLASAGHQVLCVTHLPQVAAFADCHWSVAKSTVDGRNRPIIERLEGDARVDELAAMLGGALTDAARRNARELLDRAEVGKAQLERGSGGVAPRRED